jgi:hypothetical protein
MFLPAEWKFIRNLQEIHVIEIHSILICMQGESYSPQNMHLFGAPGLGFMTNRQVLEKYKDLAQALL